MSKDKNNRIAELEYQLAKSEKALELACVKMPFISDACTCPPTYYDARDEYGSDEPYYIREDGCEGDEEDCLNCMIKYFKTRAEKSITNKGDN